MEMHLLGCVSYLKGCKEIVDAFSKSDLLLDGHMKASYKYFKEAACIFNFINVELLKQSHAAPRAVPIPEMTVWGNTMYAKMAQTHGIMTAFEKAVNERMKAEMLARIAKNVRIR